MRRPPLLAALLCTCLGLTFPANATPSAEVFKADPTNQLPLKPARRIEFDTDEGTWMSPDLSPDGKSLVFDMLGDLYLMPVQGGRAKAITRGLPFDSQPVFSPDGAWIAFTSDRSGAENLWTMRPDGSGLRQISHVEDVTEFVSPAWSADGRSIYVSTYKPDLTAYELWRYDLNGAAPAQITQAKTTPDQSKDARLSVLGPALSKDGRYLYAAQKTSGFDEDMTLPIWSIVRRDLATGANDTLVTAPKAKMAGVSSPMGEETEASNQGSAMRPAIAPDGRRLVYATRYRGETGLRVRDLTSGADRWLAYPVQHDGQEGLESRDTMPRIVFTPDGAAVVTSFGGKFHRIELVSGRDTLIPFRAHVAVDLGPYLRQPLKDETGPVRARLIQTPVQSPDGRRLVFSALGRVYVMELDGKSAPRPLNGLQAPAYQPSWSPDGRTLVYITWTAKDGGAIWSAPVDGSAQPKRLSAQGAYYTRPVVSPDGRSVLALRSSNYVRLHTYMEYGPSRQADLIALPISGGDERVVTSGSMAGQAQFVLGDPTHVYLNIDGGLSAVDLHSGGRKPVLTAQGPGFYFIEGRVPVDDIKISPNGRFALVQIAQQLHLIAMPQPGSAAVDVDAPSVQHRKLTSVGADFFGWADGGATISWAIGATYYRRPLASVSLDSPGAAPAIGERPAIGENSLEAFTARVELPRDIPHGALLLRGATAITEKGDEVVADADILVVDNRIAALGARGAVAVPTGTTIRDLTGKYVMPGLIDTHDHWAEIRREVFDLTDWGYRADLAYGKTTGLDPSPLSIDMLAYQDMVEAGLMTGPRIYSTGPAIFSFNEFTSPQQVEDLLSRYPDFYRTRNLKEYRTGDRRVREWIIQACQKLGIMATTEGALDMKLDLTQIMDGYPGAEHAMTAVPLYRDVVELMARARVSYTLTLQISHGGPPAQNDFIERDRPIADPKMNAYWPPFALEQKTSRRRWYDQTEYVYASFAASAGKVQAAGGLLGVGSHGEIPGPGQAWETEAYAAGMGSAAALRAATIGSAETIGRQAEIGSLEADKLADLLILDKDPRQDISNLRTSLRQVMKNGRLYDAATLNVVWPRARQAPSPWFAADQLTASTKVHIP